MAKRGSHYIGYFKNGQAVGNFWIGLANNGFINGMVDEMGQVTGDNLVFIYPDGITALKGRFENTYMKNARNVDVKQYDCDENGLLIATDFTEYPHDDLVCIKFRVEENCNEEKILQNKPGRKRKENVTLKK